MTLRSLTMSRFWRDWEDRFMSNSSQFITPTNDEVIRESDNVGGSCCGGVVKGSINVWIHIYETFSYRLSKEWKTPEETIMDREGDCEDLCFLMLSMIPHVGVEQAKLSIGYIETLSNSGAHTWVEVDGVIMDPTGNKQDVSRATYRKVTDFTINYE